MSLILLVYFTVLIISSASGIIQLRFLSSSDKWLCYLLITTFASEICSEVAIREFRNNMLIFHIWSPVELFLICMYFNEAIAALKKNHVGILVGCIGVLIAVLNAVFLQPVDTINSVFLLYEGFAIIGLCLFSFYWLVLKEQEILRNTHFWFSTTLLIYWSAVFVYWGMYPFFLTILKSYMPVLTFTLRIITIAAYSAFGLIFLFYKKMQTKSG